MTLREWQHHTGKFVVFKKDGSVTMPDWYNNEEHRNLLFGVSDYSVDFVGNWLVLRPRDESRNVDNSTESI